MFRAEQSDILSRAGSDHCPPWGTSGCCIACW